MALTHQIEFRPDRLKMRRSACHFCRECTLKPSRTGLFGEGDLHKVG